MGEGQLYWENRNLTCAENLKLATTWKPTLSSSILVEYPHLNQGKWVSPLVHSQHNLDSMVGGGWWSAGPAKNIWHIWHQIKKLNETTQNQTRRMRQQTSPDSLLLNLWRSAKPNYHLSSEKKSSLQGLVGKLLRKLGIATCLLRWTPGGRQKTY